MHYAYGDLDWQSAGEGWETATVELGEQDTAWNPASTKHVVYGPAKITYERHRTGITAYVE